jgi:hypothetical protein
MENLPIYHKAEEIRRWHMDRGWTDIGYHRLIDRNGKKCDGRPMARDGAHTLRKNKGTIGICLIGGHGSAETDAPLDNFTPAQLMAAREEIAALRKQFPTITRVSGHNEYAAKACPGFNVPKWLASAPEIKPAWKPARPTAKPADTAAGWAAVVAFFTKLFGGK